MDATFKNKKARLCSGSAKAASMAMLSKLPKIDGQGFSRRNPFFQEVLQLDSGERAGISECWWNCQEPVLWQEIANTSRVLD